MTKRSTALSENQRMAIFEEGKRAALEGHSLYTNPYFHDERDERLVRWIEGYKSLER